MLATTTSTSEVTAVHGAVPATVYLNVYVPTVLKPLTFTFAELAEGLKVTFVPEGPVTRLHVPTAEPVPERDAVGPTTEAWDGPALEEGPELTLTAIAVLGLSHAPAFEKHNK